MFLAEKTVKNYVSHLLAKLGMQRRSEAAAYAARLSRAAPPVLLSPDGHDQPVTGALGTRSRGSGRW